MLSAELALHGLDLSKTGTTYAPKNGGIAGRSAQVKALKKSSKTSGTGEFKKPGSTADYDLYYAIHLYNWSKSGSKTVVSNTYDFAKKGYDGLQE